MADATVYYTGTDRDQTGSVLTELTFIINLNHLVADWISFFPSLDPKANRKLFNLICCEWSGTFSSFMFLSIISIDHKGQHALSLSGLSILFESGPRTQVSHRASVLTTQINKQTNHEGLQLVIIYFC